MGTLSTIRRHFRDYQIDCRLHEDEKIVQYRIITGNVHNRPIDGRETNVCCVTICKCCGSVIAKRWE